MGGLLWVSLKKRRWIILVSVFSGSLGKTGFLCADWYEEIGLILAGWDGLTIWDGGTNVSRNRNESVTIGS